MQEQNILPTDISFERWLTYIFDHPVPYPTPEQKEIERQENERRDAFYKQYQSGEITMQELGAARDAGEYTFPYPWSAWHWQNDSDYWNPDADPARTVRYITRLFEDIVACTPYLSTEQREDQADEAINPLNSSCYMWWDVFPFHGRATRYMEHWETTERESLAKYFKLSGDELEVEFAKRREAQLAESQRREELNNAFLVVMERTLTLSNPACQEGALHGLGHWHSAYPQRVEAAIDLYLAHQPDLQPALRAYAEQARVGSVA